MVLKITILAFVLTGCFVGSSDREEVSPLAGSDAGSCPNDDCDPNQTPPPPPTDGGGSGSGSGSGTLRAAAAANACDTSPPALPAGCVVYRGDAQWLNCWYQNGYTTPVGCMTAGGIGASCEFSDATIQMIAATCNMKTTTADKILCAIDQERGTFGGGNGTGGNVCRHFARCFKKIWEAMGGSQTFTSRWLGLSGHAFNLIPTTGGGQYVVDSSNDANGIMYWCP
jgi:hypothetical protein